MQELNRDSFWKTGMKVCGEYFGVPYKGIISDETRPTPDYQNVQFVVELEEPITVFSTIRNSIYVVTNSDANTIYLANDLMI